MHGYELRKQITNVLGVFRALSYGSLYPCLHELLAAGLIAEEHDETEPAGPARPTGRARIFRVVASRRSRPRGRRFCVYRAGEKQALSFTLRADQSMLTMSAA